MKIINTFYVLQSLKFKLNHYKEQNYYNQLKILLKNLN